MEKRIENKYDLEERKRVGELCEKKKKIRMKRKDGTKERIGMSDRKSEMRSRMKNNQMI